MALKESVRSSLIPRNVGVLLVGISALLKMRVGWRRAFIGALLKMVASHFSVFTVIFQRNILELVEAYLKKALSFIDVLS